MKAGIRNAPTTLSFANRLLLRSSTLLAQWAASGALGALIPRQFPELGRNSDFGFVLPGYYLENFPEKYCGPTFLFDLFHLGSQRLYRVHAGKC